ncbi:hypothetical protein GJ744_010617 [Endocarpon pusillum]|uniref:Transcription factor TFIIIC triple barrel domain-containing protein n=1 Tax=Endocarpon pusillum TaxID=364733 RepID=A0A8H7EAX7_9EURO|nr:hypothetical protein GJ744_010617 [Endocarpon pusillum]
MNNLEWTNHKDSEYEYEYHPTETETFYVDLDLSTANGGRREPLKRTKLSQQSENEDDQESRPSTGPVDANAQADNGAAKDNEDAQDDQGVAEGPSTIKPPANDIQILDLHGQNPVISYQNQIYRCTWSDMIGTAMFFTKAEAGNDQEALMSTDEFYLMNTSRIKLIGQKAKLVGKPGRKRQRQADEESLDAVHADTENEEDTYVPAGKSLGEIRTSNPKMNADIRRQAAFLEKLMDVKRARGEFDNVRTVFSQRKNTRIIQPRDIETGRIRPREEFPSVSVEIEELNRRVVRGDATALMRLQDIYSSMEGDPQKISSSSTHSDGLRPNT